MNAERLHAVGLAISEDFRKTQSLQLLAQLRDSLQNQVNQPQQPAHQKRVSELREEFDRTLADAPSNSFSPAWKMTLDELGATPLLGNQIRLAVREVFERNQITPSVASSELSEIYTRHEILSTAIGQLLFGLSTLHVGSEELAPGECELGLLVPRAAVDNKLGEFAQELATLNKTFAIFSELATGTRDGFQIRTVSSSELTVFLLLAPKVAAFVAVAVERLVALYKQLLEVRALRQQLSDRGVSPKDLKGIDTHANELMKKGVEELVARMLKDALSRIDQGRRNELKTELTVALNRLANRIDRGYSIEIRVQPLDPTGEVEEDDAEFQDAVTKALEASRGIQFLKPNGEPILELPERIGDEEKGRK